MQQANPLILTINGGSSSIKFSLFQVTAPLLRVFEGAIERIGLPEATLWADGLKQEDSFSRSVTAPDHKSAVDVLMNWLEGRLGRNALAAVGHRVIHGGAEHTAVQRITTEMVGELHRLNPFDSEHLPEDILLTEAFHHDLSRVAQLLPIPNLYAAQGVCRYGFHGLSYAFLMEELARVAGAEAAQGRIILVHLGNGASLSAVLGGKPVDTSMGFTPATGVPMSAGSGDLDPGLIWYLARTENISAKKFNEMVNSKSGLLKISEPGTDMWDLFEREAEEVRAAEAIALFCHQIKKLIGGFAAALGGLDTLVFSGGIGENAPVIRARICAGLEFFGIELNRERNVGNAALISADSGRVEVRVIHTD